MTRNIFAPGNAVILCLVMLIAMPAFSDEGKTASKDTLFNGKQRAVAAFVHDEHNEKAGIEGCATCHHLYENGEQLTDESSEDMRCSDCHHVNKGYPTRPLIRAYHDLCKGCHLDNKVGPIMCGQCHPPG
jgi:hypothetical protein